MTQQAYGVQEFVDAGDGTIERGLAYPCRSADIDRKEASRRSRRRGVVGATAFWCPLAMVYDSSLEPVTLAVFGSVPNSVEETLPF